MQFHVDGDLVYKGSMNRRQRAELKPWEKSSDGCRYRGQEAKRECLGSM